MINNNYSWPHSFCRPGRSAIFPALLKHSIVRDLRSQPLLSAHLLPYTSKQLVPNTLSIASTESTSMRPGFFLISVCFRSHSSYASRRVPPATYFLSPISTSRSTVLCFCPLEHHFTQCTPKRSRSKNRRYSTHHSHTPPAPSWLVSYTRRMSSRLAFSCCTSISFIIAVGAFDCSISTESCSCCRCCCSSQLGSSSSVGIGPAAKACCGLVRSAAEASWLKAASELKVSGLLKEVKGSARCARAGRGVVVDAR